MNTQVIEKTTGYYKEPVAIELAVLLLALNEAPIERTKLIHLMYLIERESLLRYGSPVAYDEYFATDGGIIMANTWAALVGDSSNDPPLENWAKSVYCDGDFIVQIADFQPRKLSRALMRLAEEIFLSFGHLTNEELSQWMILKENIPERQKATGLLRPIKIKDILKAGGYSLDDIEEIWGDIQLHQSIIMRFLNCRSSVHAAIKIIGYDDLDITFVTSYYDIPLTGLHFQDGRYFLFELLDYDNSIYGLTSLNRMQEIKELIGKTLFEVFCGTHWSKNNWASSHLHSDLAPWLRKFRSHFYRLLSWI